MIWGYLGVSLIFGYIIKNLCQYYFKFTNKSKILCFIYSPILIPYLIGLYLIRKYQIKKLIKDKSLLRANKYIQTYIYKSNDLIKIIKQWLELDFFFPTSTRITKNTATICYVFLMIYLTSDSTSGWKYNLNNTWKNIKMIFPTNLWANYVGQSFIAAINGKLLDNDWCRTFDNNDKTVYYSYDVCFGRLRIYKTIYNDGDNLFLKTIENIYSEDKKEISISKEIVYDKFIFTKKDALKSFEYFQSLDIFDDISFSIYHSELEQLNELKSDYSREKLLEIIYYFLRNANDLGTETKDCFNTLVWKSEDENDISKLEKYIDKIISNEKNHYYKFNLDFYNTYWKDLFWEWFY